MCVGKDSILYTESCTCIEYPFLLLKYPHLIFPYLKNPYQVYPYLAVDPSLCFAISMAVDSSGAIVIT